MLSKERSEAGVRVYQEDVLQRDVKQPDVTFGGQERVFSRT